MAKQQQGQNVQDKSQHEKGNISTVGECQTNSEQVKIDESPDEEDSMSETDHEELLPSYLSSYVFPYGGDFWCSRCFDPRLIVQLMSEGFLPISTAHLLLPKLHEQRSVLMLSSDLHISKSTKKKAKKWEISTNTSFEGVVKGCHEQHGISWLYPQIVSAFRNIQSNGDDGIKAMIYSKRDQGTMCTIRLYSVEVWNVAGGKLVAGELGYTVGDIYTSLTGFSLEDSSGTVQLGALGKLLRASGFKIWDLGMSMDYKESLGAKLMRRKSFVKEVKRAREGADVVLRCNGRINIKDILKPSDNTSSDGAEKKIQTKRRKSQKRDRPLDSNSNRNVAPNCSVESPGSPRNIGAQKESDIK